MDKYLTILMLLVLASGGHTLDVVYTAEDLALTVIPNDIPIDVTILELRGNVITSVGANELAYLSLLEVNLRHNNIDQFSSDAFGSPCVPGPCVQLDKLLLAKNTLDTVPDLPIIGPTLKMLDMSYNNISSLSPNVMFNLDALEELDLAGNPIFWPADVSGLDNVGDTLLTLNLSFAAKSGSVSNISFLQSFVKLQTLVIEDIKLFDLPDFTGYAICHTLKVMYATNNLLHNSFMPQLDCLTSIKVLHFYYNEFDEFPVFSTSIRSSVEVINIGDQFISTVDVTLLEGMVSLQHLTLKINDIEIFPVLLQELTQLKYIDLSKNSITDLTRDHFIPLPNLEFLDISNNLISVIPDVADLYLGATVVFDIVAEGNQFICDCDFNFTLRASDAYNSVPKMNITLSQKPCFSPEEYVGVNYTDMKLYDFCPAFSTVTTTAMDTTTKTKTSTVPDTTTEPETSTVPDTTDVTTTEPVVCEPVPLWLNIETATTEPQLGDVIDYQCQDGLQFEDIIDEEELDGEPDTVVTKTSKCSKTDGSWEQQFVGCLELIDAEEEKSYWTPVEAENAEFIGMTAIIFLVLETAFILLMDSPTFIKAYHHSFHKHRMSKLKQHVTHNKVGQSTDPSKQDVTEVSLEELGDDSIV